MSTPSQEAFGNPTPLGLVTFGLSTLLLSFANAGLYPSGTLIVAQALFLGGVVQLIAGILEFVKGNTFGGVVFGSFGGFWICVGMLTILPKLGFAPETNAGEAGTFMLLFAVFVFFMLLGCLKAGKLLVFVVATLVLLLVVLAIANYTGSAGITKLAGWVGVVCGGSALYLGGAITGELTAGKKVLPYS
jgi:succinate-acetate transporter protein